MTDQGKDREEMKKGTGERVDNLGGCLAFCLKRGRVIWRIRNVLMI